jgi:hypothetical protein
MSPEEQREFLIEHGDTKVFKPTDPSVHMTLNEALADCEDDEGANHLQKAFDGMTVKEAADLVMDLTVTAEQVEVE